MSDSSHTSEPEQVQRESYLPTAIANGVTRRLSTPAWVARATGVGLCLVSLGSVVAFAVAYGSGGELALITKPLPMRIALVFPYLILVFTLGTGVGAMLAWWNRYWSLSARIHQTLLALLGLGFSWQLATLGFLTV